MLGVQKILDRRGRRRPSLQCNVSVVLLLLSKSLLICCVDEKAKFWETKMKFGFLNEGVKTANQKFSPSSK